MIRQGWIDTGDEMPMSRQCFMAGVSLSTVYVDKKPKEANESDLRLKGLIDEEYTRHPFYVSRRMVVFLETKGQSVNRKRIQGLMQARG